MTTRAQVEAIQDPNRREHFVYWVYDAHGALLYIGCSMQLDGRWREHRSQSDWSQYAKSFLLQGPYNYETARRLERNAIREHQPPFNADTATYMAAKRKKNLLFERLTDEYLADGMSRDQAGSLALREIDRRMPQPLLYRPLRIA